MHKAIACSQRPQWRCAHEIGCHCELWRGQNRYPVTGTDVVEKEVAIGMDDFVS